MKTPQVVAAIAARDGREGQELRRRRPSTSTPTAASSRRSPASTPCQAIEEDLPIYRPSEETTTTIQTGRWNNGATPYTDAGIDGGGADKASFADDQILMILDNGIQLDAGDLSNTRTDGASTHAGRSRTHRKVAFYGTTNPFGGSGDLLGCDNATTSGVTHGHTVAAVALGNATRVPASYGHGWQATDAPGEPLGSRRHRAQGAT